MSHPIPDAALAFQIEIAEARGYERGTRDALLKGAMAVESFAAQVIVLTGRVREAVDAIDQMAGSTFDPVEGITAENAGPVREIEKRLGLSSPNPAPTPVRQPRSAAATPIEGDSLPPVPGATPVTLRNPQDREEDVR